jgi:hypothetical protein
MRRWSPRFKPRQRASGPPREGSRSGRIRGAGAVRRTQREAPAQLGGRQAEASCQPNGDGLAGSIPK